MRVIFGLLSFVLILGVCGCQNSCTTIIEENKTLAFDNSDLTKQVEDLTRSNEALQQQILTLSGLNPDAKIKNIVTVDKIEVAKRTSIYDKDRDGNKESLIVYLKTLDSYGDAIKGAGAVEVELWNLDLNQQDAKIAGWTITPSELKNKWAGTVMTNYYRLVFDVEDKSELLEGNLTVKVNFTDYLTGRQFSQQLPINNLVSF